MPSQPFTVPTNRLPRLLPSSPSHPIIFLPVPDPTSFQLLVHWIYFGHTNYIEECLSQGVIQWEGLARNVEYLGLPTSIKIFLGRWYRNWLHPGRARKDNDCHLISDDEDDYYSDEDGDGDDEEEFDCSSEEGMDVESEVERENLEEEARGRERLARHLASYRLPAPRPRSA
jgi:hypothetical protein